MVMICNDSWSWFRMGLILLMTINNGQWCVNDSGKLFTLYSGTLFPSCFCSETGWRKMMYDSCSKLGNTKAFEGRVFFLLGNLLTKLSRISNLSNTLFFQDWHGLLCQGLVKAYGPTSWLRRHVLIWGHERSVVHEFFGMKSRLTFPALSCQEAVRARCPASEVKKMTGNLSCQII